MSLNKTIDDFPALTAKQCFTKSPPRFSDTSICSQLDKLNILRPSMANGQITSLLEKRRYVNTKKGIITVTDLGIRVVDFLVESEFNFIDPQFTAQMESQLDAISEGHGSKLELLQSFWTSLKEGIERGKNVKNKNQKSEYKCPLCDSFLLLKFSKFGPFYSCEKYSNKGDGCSYTANADDNLKPVEKVKKELEYAEFVCKDCGSQMVKRKSKHGNEFYGCENFFKTGCKCTADLDGVFKEKTKYKKSKKPFKKFKKK